MPDAQQYIMPSYARTMQHYFLANKLQKLKHFAASDYKLHVQSQNANVTSVMDTRERDASVYCLSLTYKNATVILTNRDIIEDIQKGLKRLAISLSQCQSHISVAKITSVGEKIR